MFQVDIIEPCKQNNRKAQLQIYNQYCNGMYIVAKRFLNDANDERFTRLNGQYRDVCIKMNLDFI